MFAHYRRFRKTGTFCNNLFLDLFREYLSFTKINLCIALRKYSLLTTSSICPSTSILWGSVNETTWHLRFAKKSYQFDVYRQTCISKVKGFIFEVYKSYYLFIIIRDLRTLNSTNWCQKRDRFIVSKPKIFNKSTLTNHRLQIKGEIQQLFLYVLN